MIGKEKYIYVDENGYVHILTEDDLPKCPKTGEPAGVWIIGGKKSEALKTEHINCRCDTEIISNSDCVKVRKGDVKMTAKRFTVDSDGKYWDRVSHKYVTIDYLFYLVEKLEKENENIYDENEDLHAKNQTLDDELYIKECDILDLKKENEQLKKELKVYHKVARCSNCKYHNYDWYIDDGYGGEEYEVCDKGNDLTDGICEDWEEL